jgi:predicted amidohydrolase
VVIGMEERAKEGRIYNAAILIDRTGAIRLHHRKINELEIATSVYSTGTSLNVSTMEDCPVALSICADSWRPEVTDALWLMGARLIFSPSAWAVEPGGESTNLNWIKETYRQRLAGRNLFLVAPNGVGAIEEGVWKGRVLQGNSLVIGPGGEPLLVGPTGEPALLCCEVPIQRGRT